MVSILRQMVTRTASQLFSPNIITNQIKYSSIGALISPSHKFYSNTFTTYEEVDPESQTKLTKEITQKINDLVTTNKQGRLFAVVHVAGKQRKITNGDIIVVEGYWPPDIGDKISLDKVMLVGGADFTLVGTPIVQRGLVNVEATVIEKTLSHTKTNFKKKRRKQYMRINFFRIPQTYLRINKIEVKGELNNPADVRGLETVIF